MFIKMHKVHYNNELLKSSTLIWLAKPYVLMFLCLKKKFAYKFSIVPTYLTVFRFHL